MAKDNAATKESKETKALKESKETKEIKETPQEIMITRPAGPRMPDHFHDELLAQFQYSLKNEGEVAFERWGLSLIHSLSDPDFETLREQWNYPLKDALDYYNRGCLFAMRDQFADAIAMFEKAAKLDPTLSNAFYNRALALERAGKSREAATAWKEFIDLFGKLDDAQDARNHLEAL